MKKFFAIMLSVVMLISVLAAIPSFAAPQQGVNTTAATTEKQPVAPNPPTNVSEFPGVAEKTPLHSVDFKGMRTENQLNNAGWYKQGKDIHLNFLTTGVRLSASTGFNKNEADKEDPAAGFAATGHLVCNAVEFNKDDTYVIDYTMQFDTEVHIHFASLGYPVPEEDSSVPATLEPAQFYKMDQQGSFKLRPTVRNCAADNYYYYSSPEYSKTVDNMDAAGVGLAAQSQSMRIRILVDRGESKYAYISVGPYEYYLKKNNPITLVEGLFGFSHIGGENDARGVIIEKVDIYQCTMDRNDGGDTVVEEQTKNYEDTAATYYKDGYVLHNMDFSKVDDFADTNYSFATSSTYDRTVIIDQDNGVLSYKNIGDTSAYMLLTGNAIPAAITEYTVAFTFRFVSGGDKPNFAFIRGMKLDEDGARTSSREIDIFQKNVAKQSDAYIADAEPTDAAKFAIVQKAMTDGEFVTVTISSTMRYVDTIAVTYGDTTVEFELEAKKNRVAPDGYMGFLLGPQTTVEMANIMVIAGNAEYIEKAGTITWPTGVTAGDLVQTVAAEAVNASGTKPVYESPVPEDDGDGDGDGDGGDGNTGTTAAATTAAPSETEPAEEEKKGCKSSIAVAVPALIVTTVLGCAVTSKKRKED